MFVDQTADATLSQHAGSSFVVLLLDEFLFRLGELGVVKRDVMVATSDSFFYDHFRFANLFESDITREFVFEQSAYVFVDRPQKLVTVVTLGVLYLCDYLFDNIFVGFNQFFYVYVVYKFFGVASEQPF